MVGTVALVAAPACLSERLCGSAEAAVPKARRDGNDFWNFILERDTQNYQAADLMCLRF